MLSKVFILKTNIFLTRQDVRFLRAKRRIFRYLSAWIIRKNKKSVNFIRMLILCAVVQQKRRRAIEFVIVIVAEDG
jgi:hypothetical protein